MEVLKRIIKHARREGKSSKEAFEQASYRLERTYGAVYAFWSSNIPQDFKQYVKSIERLNPAPHKSEPDEYETAIEEAFERAGKGYTVDDLPFADVGDMDEQYADKHPEQYHPPEEEADTRYNVPRLPPNAGAMDIEHAISDNEIYSKTREAILNAQRRQVAYGLDKYPEPLNADTWTIIETIDHIISETADKLHYLTMLKIKLQQGTEE